MILKNIPIWIIAVGTIFILLLTIEGGYRLSLAIHKRAKFEKESLVSVISGAILGLLAFMLAFTFGILYTRYDARKELVRIEANAIATTWLWSDFMPETDHGKTVKLLKDYVDLRVSAFQLEDQNRNENALKESDRIQHQLWDVVVVNARKDMNSVEATLYIESLNSVIDTHNLWVTGRL